MRYDLLISDLGNEPILIGVCILLSSAPIHTHTHTQPISSMTFHFWYAFAKAIITLPDPLAREQRIVQFRPAYGQLIEHLRGKLLTALLVNVARSIMVQPCQHRRRNTVIRY